jgi:hypothetical protein
MVLHRAPVELFQPGDEIPKSGIYRVRHCGHHHDHEVTCISGDIFPTCRECHGRVRFSLIIAAHAIERHLHFSDFEWRTPAADFIRQGVSNSAQNLAPVGKPPQA